MNHQDHHNMDHGHEMDHTHEHSHEAGHDHDLHSQSTAHEYVKFGFVIAGIIMLSAGLYLSYGSGVSDFMRFFMGVFFAVFGLFKLADLKGFAHSYIGYDLIAKRSRVWAYLYPFIELGLAALYFAGIFFANYITLPLMLIGAYGVSKQLARKSKITCACLGTYIKLPLTTVSLVEDLLMAAMAAFMIISSL